MDCFPEATPLRPGMEGTQSVSSSLHETTGPTPPHPLPAWKTASTVSGREVPMAPPDQQVVIV